MKLFKLIVVFSVLINALPIAAMQSEGYSQRFSRGLKTAREFAQKHKRTIIAAIVTAAVVAALGGSAVAAGRKLASIQSNVIKIYNKHGFEMAKLKEYNKDDFERLVSLGMALYLRRFELLNEEESKAAVDEVIKELDQNEILGYLPLDYPKLPDALLDLLYVKKNKK